jgi:hypothetical protein
MRAQQRRDLLAYEESLRSGESDPVIEWRQEVQAWEADRTLPNPYAPRSVGESWSSFAPANSEASAAITLNDVRAHLSQEEEAMQTDSASFLHGEVSPSGLVTSGMDLELQQYVANVGDQA